MPVRRSVVEGGGDRVVPQPGAGERRRLALAVDRCGALRERDGRGAQDRRTGDDVARPGLGIEDDRHRPGVDDAGLEPGAIVGEAQRIDPRGAGRLYRRLEGRRGLKRCPDRELHRPGDGPRHEVVERRRRAGRLAGMIGWRQELDRRQWRRRLDGAARGAADPPARCAAQGRAIDDSGALLRFLGRCFALRRGRSSRWRPGLRDRGVGRERSGGRSEGEDCGEERAFRHVWSARPLQPIADQEEGRPIGGVIVAQACGEAPLCGLQGVRFRQARSQSAIEIDGQLGGSLVADIP